MEQMVREHHGDMYPLDGGLDDSGFGGGHDDMAVGPTHDPVATAVLGRHRHLTRRCEGGHRGDGHEPWREYPGPHHGRVDGYVTGAALVN